MTPGATDAALPAAEERQPPRRASRAARLAGSAMVGLGIVLLVWAVVVWRWEDPFTSLYTRFEQQRLERQLAELPRPAPVVPPVTSTPVSPSARATAEAGRIRREARAFQAAAVAGHAIGRIRVPRLGLDMVVVEGTGREALKRGPGRDERTFMPGEGKLVYIAGHRTTYGAPFADIDKLRPGDRITLEMPYGTFVYRVVRHAIVDDNDLSVLRSGLREEVALQACHPRFFATQRYIVWARPVRSATTGTTVSALPST